MDKYDYNKKLLTSYLKNEISAKRLLDLWKVDNRELKGFAKAC